MDSLTPHSLFDDTCTLQRVQPHDFACECIQQRYSTTYATSLTTNTTSQECDASHRLSGMSLTTSSPDQLPPPPSHPLPQQHMPQRPPIPLTAALLLEKLAPSKDDDPDDTEPLIDSFSSSSSSRVDIESSHHQIGSTAMDDGDDDENHSTNSTTSSVDRPPGCTICLEAFQVGDSVSWSTDPTCGHVFHHSCIREWLLRRVACPCCRTVLLPVDRPILFPPTTTTSPTVPRTIQGGEADNAASASSSGAGTFTGMFLNAPNPGTTTMGRRASRGKVTQKKQRLTTQMIEIYAEERSRRTITSYYCIHDGLVTLDAFGLAPREPDTTSLLLESPQRRFIGLSRGSSSHRTTTDTKENGNTPLSMSSPAGTTTASGISSSAAGAANSDSSSWLEGILSRMLRRSNTEYSNAAPTRTSSSSSLCNGTNSPTSPDQTFDMLEDEDDEHDLVIQDDEVIHASAQIHVDDGCAPGDGLSS